MHAELLAPRDVDSSGISSSAAVGVACLLALEAASGLKVSRSDNILLDRCECRTPKLESRHLNLRGVWKISDRYIKRSCLIMSIKYLKFDVSAAAQVLNLSQGQKMCASSRVDQIPPLVLQAQIG